MLMTTTSMDSDSDEEPVPAPIMVQQAPTGPPMPVNYYPQPPVPHASYPWQTPQQQGPFRSNNQRPRPTCWICGRQGHAKRDCRSRPSQRPRDDYRPRQSGPRSDDYRGSQNRPRPDDYKGSHDEPRYQDQRYQEPRPQDCIGITGTTAESPLTIPVPVGPFPDVMARFLVSDTCPINLLGADLLQRLRASINYTLQGLQLELHDPRSEEGTMDRCVLRALPLMLQQIHQPDPLYGVPDRVSAQLPSSLWSTGPDDVGLLPVPPVMVYLKEGAQPPRIPQYPLKMAQEQGLSTQIQALVKQGVLVYCTSSCNTPLFPVQKKTPKGSPPKYRLVQDLRAINAATVLETPVVPNPNTLLASIPPSAKVFTVIDLANAFFSVPLHLKCRYMFAFTSCGSQLTWTRCPRGAQNSPNQFTQAMKTVLSPWIAEHSQVTLLQYVDDLLLCADSKPLLEQESLSLLLYLSTANCKVSKDKVQWCHAKVIFLGHCVSQGARHLTEDRKSAIAKLPFPSTINQLQSFLGLITYCRQWIPDASRLMQPLYDCLKSGEPQGASPLVLPHLQDCHHQLKMAISRAPALELPDYTHPFNLFVSESEGHATGVLAQQHAGRQRPIGYYSCRLDPVARTSPTFLKAVHAAHALLDKTADIVLGHDLIIQASHDLATVLSQTQPRHMAHQRYLRLQCSLLLPSHITFKRCSVINPATLLPHSRGEEGDSEVAPEVEDPHDCLQVLLDDTSTLPGVTTQELPHPDLELWTDGSRFADQSGRYHTDYAVTTETQVVKAEAIPASMSAQEAELIALKEACTLAKGKTVNIRTDSRYAHGIAHDFGIIWKNRGFITAAGTPVKQADLIKSLMEALQLPTKVAVAVIKVKAHGKVNSKATRGNYLADCAAKEAAIGNVSSEWLERIPKEKQEMTYPCMVATRAQKKKEEEEKIISPTLAQLQEEQKTAPEEQHKAWKTWGAAYENGLWTMQGLVCLPRKLYPAIAAWAHGVTHRGKNQALGYAKSILLQDYLQL
ncbi:uncharacterized protein [Engystomops pustulosus]|uniref:uncharacterized protein n=1 Tax=Engystomops pustulosus TaxID=76066 RepID=UPI003AFB0284